MRNPVRLKNLNPRFLPFYLAGAAALVFMQPTLPGLVVGLVLMLLGAVLRAWGAGHLVKNDSLTVTGTLDVTWDGTCRRCLDPAAGATEVEIQEIFERRPVEGETYELGDDAVDLAPMVLEQVVLSLPLAPLCAEDCAGPAPDAFPASVEADVDLTEPAGDPRWAALDALKFDDD